MLLLQREIPAFVNLEAAKSAKAKGMENRKEEYRDVRSFGIGGMSKPLSDDLVSHANIISPNEVIRSFSIFFLKREFPWDILSVI